MTTFHLVVKTRNVKYSSLSYDKEIASNV